MGTLNILLVSDLLYNLILTQLCDNFEFNSLDPHK